MEAAKCRSDVSVLNYKWRTNSPFPDVDRSIVQECRNWPVVRQWSKEHAVDAFTPGLLVHPEFGMFYSSMIHPL
jgi:hypothetical protein